MADRARWSFALGLSLVAAPAAADEPAVRLGGSYVTDVLAVVDGGRARGAGWLGRADVTLAADGSAIGLGGVRFFADVLATQPGDFSGNKVGDFQTVSNVQADSALRPFELYVEAPVTHRLSVKAGLVDLNTEFDVQRIGALFLNSAHGIGPDFSQSGVNGPSIFPASATAVIGRYDGGAWRARIGLFDAVAGSLPDPRRTVFRLPGAKGALIVGEVERLFGSAEVQLGAWRYTDRFPAQASVDRRVASQGAYALVEGPLSGRLSGWLRIGLADARANPIAAYVGGGLTHGDDRSQLGIAIARAMLRGPARRSLLDGVRARRAETAIELTWARRIAKGVTIQPDIQYVIDPGWNPAVRDALVIGSRFRFAIGD
ncbi:MAG TPA: carbohydrate porin [Sphingomonas sp.]|nr:carbohydrate porin [Sphingomonas sp.]